MIELIDKYSLKVGMKEFLNRNPEELSGGEKQRVAIAGVLSMNPDIIIFDEAVSMLDPHGVKEVIDIINSLKGTKTILNITHNLNEALLADKVIVINDGKVELVGSPKEVFKEYKKLKEYGLDILDSMKLIDMLDAINFDGIEQVKEALWELSYQK